MTTERVQIVVSQRGAKRAADDIRKIGDKAKESNSFVNQLNNAIAAVGVGVAIAKVRSLTDAFTGMSNLLATTSENQTQVNKKLDQLFRIANKTRVPVEALTSVYQRGSIAAKELGASQDQLFQFTESVGLALAQQGGSAQSASGALLQLSQALGSGIVRAEEFNSILEGAFPLALAAAKGLDEAGGSVARLRTLVINGKVSSDAFFRAILSQTDGLREAFAKTTPTISQAFVVLNNAMTQTVGQFDQALGASASLSRALLTVAANAETLVRAAGSLAIIIGVKLAKEALVFAVAGVRALTVAIAANPLGALITGAVVAVSYLTTFADTLTVTSDGVVSFADYARAAWMVISNGAQDMASSVGIDLGRIGGFLSDFVTGVRLTGEALIRVMVGSFNVIITKWHRFPDLIADFFLRGINSGIAFFEDGFNEMIRRINSLAGSEVLGQLDFGRVANNFRSAGEEIGVAFVEGYNAPFLAEGGALDTLNKKILDKARDLAGDRVASSASVSDVLQPTAAPNRAAAPVIDEKAIENAAKKEAELRRALTGVDSELGGALAQGAEIDMLRQAQEDRLSVIKEAQEARVITEQDAAERIAAINRKLANDIAAVEQARFTMQLSAARSTFDQLASQAEGYAGKQSGIYKSLFAISKAFAIAESIVAIQTGVAKAASNPFPLNLIAMAQVAAAAGNIVSSIQSVALKFADGGPVRGPGSARSDSIPAMLSDGEYVVNARSARQHEPVLRSINEGRGVPGAGAVNVYIENHTPAQISAESDGSGNVWIIARQVADERISERVPRMIASEAANPNSRLSRSMAANTTAQRRR